MDGGNELHAAIRRCRPANEYFFDEGCHIMEVLNSEDDPSLSVARARVATGRVTRRHRLHDTVERYLILEGTGEVEIDGRPLGEVAPGDLVVIPAGATQCVRCTSATDLVFYALCTPRFTQACYQDVESR